MELTDFLASKIKSKQVMDLTEFINSKGEAQYTLSNIQIISKEKML